MKPVVMIGVLLLLLGVLALGYQGVLWVQGTEQVAKVGPVEINREKNVAIPLAPILAGVGIVGGLMLILSGNRRTV
jgi:hypothetical protein